MEKTSGQPQPGEADLVEWARRDPEAFGLLYDRYFPEIYRFACGRLQNRGEAEDLVSEIFYHALRGMPAYLDCGRPFGAWLWRIALNCLADHHRRSRNETSLDECGDFEDPNPTVERQVAARDDSRRLWSVVDRLPERQRLAITLKFRHDLPMERIGQILDITPAAAKLLVFRGMRHLRNELRSELPSRIAAEVTA
jgi:RNA polymerase sigma-70 factor (ECF subfamily)